MRARSPTRPIAVLRRRRQKLLGEAASLWLLIGGSSFERFSTCSRPQCACHKGQRHGPRTYVVVTEQKAQRQHYVPRQQVKAVQKGIRQYRRLLEIVLEVTRINLELMRSNALNNSGSKRSVGEPEGNASDPRGGIGMQRQKGEV